jgi:hypothetical protein
MLIKHNLINYTPVKELVQEIVMNYFDKINIIKDDKEKISLIKKHIVFFQLI